METIIDIPMDKNDIIVLNWSILGGIYVIVIMWILIICSILLYINTVIIIKKAVKGEVTDTNTIYGCVLIGVIVRLGICVIGSIK